MQAFVTRLDDPSHRQALSAAYARCLVEALSSRPERIRVQVVHVDASGVYVAGQPQADLALLHVYLLPGRKAAIKTALIEALTHTTMQHTGLDNDHVRVLVHEIPHESIGLGTSTATTPGF